MVQGEIAEASGCSGPLVLVTLILSSADISGSPVFWRLQQSLVFIYRKLPVTLRAILNQGPHQLDLGILLSSVHGKWLVCPPRAVWSLTLLLERQASPSWKFGAF